MSAYDSRRLTIVTHLFRLVLFFSSIFFFKAREEEENDHLKTFILKGEGHTLGNALRTLILKK